MHDAHRVACQIDDLTDDEAFLVRCVRHWAVGKREGSIVAWATVWGLFHMTLDGPEERIVEAVRRFEQMVGAISAAARRTIHHHAPACPCVDRDEASVLRLVAAQANGAASEARLIARTFVRPDGVEPLVEAAGALAEVLVAAGHAPRLKAILPLGAAPEAAAAARLH
jgi:hypothetical protein